MDVELKNERNVIRRKNVYNMYVIFLSTSSRSGLLNPGTTVVGKLIGPEDDDDFCCKSWTGSGFSAAVSTKYWYVVKKSVASVGWKMLTNFFFFLKFSYVNYVRRRECKKGRKSDKYSLVREESRLQRWNSTWNFLKFHIRSPIFRENWFFGNGFYISGSDFYLNFTGMFSMFFLVTDKISGWVIRWHIRVIDIRGWSDKYLASPPDGVTIAKRVYYSVEPSCRRLISKFQSNRICGFVLTPCRSERVHGF